MNDLPLLRRQLLAVVNLSAFGRAHVIPYRTLQRIRAGVKNANLKTVLKIERALLKAKNGVR